MASTIEEDARWTQLVAASERLAACRNLDDVVAVLRDTAREIAGASGISVILREGDKCAYVAEDAIGHLWTGQKFPAETCISGWAMLNKATAAISDIFADERVPHAAYSPTFVKSLVMVPIGQPEPVAALGAYWSDVREHDQATISRIEALARSAAIAIENARLLASVRESERQRSLAIDAGRMGVWSYDITTGELETSSVCRRNFGRDPALPFSYAELKAAVHDDDKARVDEAIAKSLATGNDYDIEYRLVTPRGDVRWIGIRAQPKYSDEGEPLMLAGVSVDITERKRMEEALRSSASTLEHLVEERTRELVDTQEALRQSQKLEAMGQLTGGVAHDFNNLLSPIIGSLDLLQRKQLGSEREQRLIAAALESADRAKTLVQRLLAFARRQPLSAAAVDLAALLRQMAPLLKTTVGPNVAIRFDCEEALPLAHADANQVEMAVLNLAVNARDAMPEGGTLTVSARRGAATPGLGMDAGLSGYVVLCVADTGSGMDEETRLRAIEPFFSTKGIGRGTGLGLSMAHGLALQLGGALSIDSALGKGTRVSLALPVSQAMAAASLADEAIASTTMEATVLLVDDEPLIRMSTADMLMDMGFEVVEASNGKEALTLIDSMPRLDVLVTDHLMPHMTGLELITAVRLTRPDLPVLVVSGYADVNGMPAELPRLEKPFRQSDLASHLAALIGSVQGSRAV